jgi:hypothetical protein
MLHKWKVFRNHKRDDWVLVGMFEVDSNEEFTAKIAISTLLKISKNKLKLEYIGPTKRF